MDTATVMQAQQHHGDGFSCWDIHLPKFSSTPASSWHKSWQSFLTSFLGLQIKIYGRQEGRKSDGSGYYYMEILNFIKNVKLQSYNVPREKQFCFLREGKNDM